MIKMAVLTAWSGDGSEDNPNHPAISDDHQLQRWEDTTGQPSENLHPDPNLLEINAWVETDEQLQAIEDDPNYYVLWSSDL